MNVQSEPVDEKRLSWLHIAGGIAVAALAVWLLTRGATSSTSGDQSEQRILEVDVAQRNEAFDYAIDTLDRLEEFDTLEMLKQALDRLDNWVQDQKPLVEWQPDPMIETLPEMIRELPVMAELDRLRFTTAAPFHDGNSLQEAVWFRDLAAWARGDEVGDVQRAKRLFDWTIRNIQLAASPPSTADSSSRMLQKPWETLLLGQGTAADRGWVFVLLARNQGLDAVVISPAGGQQPRLLGVLSRKELYLFDPILGLPVPGPDGLKLDELGNLDIQPATLSQVVADDSLLRLLDINEKVRYPLEAATLDKAVVQLVASPTCLSQRMKLVESRLAGEDKLALSADPTGQAARLKQCDHVAEVQFWSLPFAAALQESQLGSVRDDWKRAWLMPYVIGVDERPNLLKGRSLHLRGKLEGDAGATHFYQLARPSNSGLAATRQIPPQMKSVFALAKLDASYWLGLIAQHQGNDRAAIDYLATRLLAVDSNVRWQHGAIYNLARIYESLNPPQAVEFYLRDSSSPAYHGNVLRARWLHNLTGGSAVEEPKPEEKGTVEEKMGGKEPEKGDREAAEPAEKETDRAEKKAADEPEPEPGGSPQE